MEYESTQENKSSPSLVGYATTAHLCVQQASRSCVGAQDSKKNKKGKADKKIGEAGCPHLKQTIMADENRKSWVSSHALECSAWSQSKAKSFVVLSFCR